MDLDRRKGATIALITSMLLAFTFFGLNVNVASASPTTTVYIDPPSVTVTVCRNFTVDVKVRDVTDLYAWQFNMTFNPNLLTCLNVTEGPFLLTQGSTVFNYIINNTAGWVIAGCLFMTPTSVSGNGTLAYVAFHCKGSGSCALHFIPSETFLLDSSYTQILPCDIIDGSVTQTAPVGGIWVPVDKFSLLAPYIGLVSAILAATAATAIYAKRIEHRKKKQ